MAGEVSTSAKEVAKGTFWGVAGNLAFKLVSFFYTVILARMATQDDIGIFYLALSIVSLLALFVDFGISQSFARYIPFFNARGEGKNIEKMLRAGYSICTVLALISFIVIFFGADMIAGYYQNPGLSDSLRYLSPYLLIYILFQLNTVFLQGQKKIHSIALTSNLQNLAKLVLSISLFIVIGANVFTISIGYLFSYVVAVLFSFFLVWKGLKHLEGKQEQNVYSYGKLLRELLPFGLMMIAAMSMWTIIGYIDRVMIGYFLPPDIAAAQVAIYTMATSLAGLIMMFPSAIGTIFFPVVSQLFGQKKMDEMRKICATSTRWLLFITVPLALVFVTFSKQILNMFYGELYVPGALALSLFAIGLLIRAATMVPSYVLAGMRLVRIEIKIAAVAAAVNIILNVGLIPSYGIDGAAAASAVSFLVATALFIWYSKKHFGFEIDRGTWQIVIAALLSFLTAFLLEPFISPMVDGLPLSGVEYLDKVARLSVLAALFLVSVIVFAAISLALKSFREEDLGIMEGAMRRGRAPASAIRLLRSIVSLGISREKS
ncbi:MAG: flippase [Candidatus Micrarchaeota archaeon]